MTVARERAEVREIAASIIAGWTRLAATDRKNAAHWQDKVNAVKSLLSSIDGRRRALVLSRLRKKG